MNAEEVLKKQQQKGEIDVDDDAANWAFEPQPHILNQPFLTIFHLLSPPFHYNKHIKFSFSINKTKIGYQNNQT
jgi:hypothetical protein